MAEEDRGDEIDAVREADAEAELLDARPLPGMPKTERERREKWLLLPNRARLASGRLHRNFRHLPKNILVHMLSAAKAPRDYIDAFEAHRCDVCADSKGKPPIHKVSPPKPHEFNHVVGIDVFEVKDTTGVRCDILKAVDMGTVFDQGWIVRNGETVGPLSLIPL